MCVRWRRWRKWRRWLTWSWHVFKLITCVFALHVSCWFDVRAELGAEDSEFMSLIRVQLDATNWKRQTDIVPLWAPNRYGPKASRCGANPSHVQWGIKQQWIWIHYSSLPNQKVNLSQPQHLIFLLHTVPLIINSFKTASFWKTLKKQISPDTKPHRSQPSSSTSLLLKWTLI